jgi:hypothetical protein
LVSGSGFRDEKLGKITCALCSQVIFATVSNRKDENFYSYIAVNEFKVLAHFRYFGARNMISQ